MDLQLNDERDWLKATAILLLWTAAITCNWYFFKG